MLSKSLDIFSTTIGKKLLVAVTGLLVCLFLVFHLLNNLIIFTGPENFNQLVAALEKIKPLIRVMEFLLLIIFITHIYNSILLTVNSKKSRSTDYEKFSNKPLLKFLIALCTSSFEADTPLKSYLDEVMQIES